tara:strand:- start:83 stop:925 length:843 start_codon:yes stop_codon:yes gene_type:complete
LERISFYIPAYNAQNTISYALDSLLRQTYKIDEIIVIDDNSLDKTFDIVRKYEFVKLIKNQTNLGLGYNRNLAIKNCKNDIIGSIDADVVLDKNWLETLIGQINKDNVVMCGGNMIEKKINNKINLWRAKYYSQNWGKKFILNPPFLYGCNTLLKKSAWKNVNGYDESLKTNGEDVDFTNRIKSHQNYQTIYQPDAKCYHLQDDDIESLTNRIWRYHSFGYKIKKPSFRKFLKLSIKQSRFFLIRFFKSLIKFDLINIKISFKVLIKFIKLEYKSLNTKK